MLDSEIRLLGKQLEKAAGVPAAHVARIERQRTINQRRHCTDVLTEIAQRSGSIGQHSRIVPGDLKRALSAIDALSTINLRVSAPADEVAVKMEDRGPSEGRPVQRIPRDRLIEQAEPLRN